MGKVDSETYPMLSTEIVGQFARTGMAYTLRNNIRSYATLCSRIQSNSIMSEMQDAA